MVGQAEPEAPAAGAAARRRTTDRQRAKQPLSLVDAIGRPLTFRQRPQRIVSLVPSLTEALFAFGLNEEIVGVTRFCVEPRQGVAGKAKVGGTKTLNLARIRALEPDLVIASAEENSPDDVKQLIEDGWPVFVSLPTSVQGAIHLLRQLASITGTTVAARPIIRQAKETLASLRAANAGREPLRVFCPIWRNPYLTIGRGTYVHDVIAVCGGRNIFANGPGRYPEVQLAQMAALDPEVIILPSEPYRFRERHKADFRAFPVVTAVRNDHIFLVDGKTLSWYGPRIAQSLRELNALLEGVRQPRSSVSR